MSPPLKTTHRLRNRCHLSLTQHNTGAHTGAIPTSCNNTTPHHHWKTPVPRSPPSPACAIHSPPQHLPRPLQHHSQHRCPHRCHPNLMQQWHRCLAHHPSPASAIYHHPNTLVRHSTSNTTHATTSQHQSNIVLRVKWKPRVIW